MSEVHYLKDREHIFSQRSRFMELMRRHVNEDDASFTDDQFVRAVVNRYLYERGLPLIDPNE